MPWYRTGTVAITAGQTTVTGTGTAFAVNGRVGDGFLGPDGRWYEVTNIASATVLSILPAYQGATVSGGGFALAPIQGYTKTLADSVNNLVNQWGSTLAGLGSVSTEDVVPVAKGGTGSGSAANARVNLGLGTAATLTATTSVTDSTVGRAMKVGDFQMGVTAMGNNITDFLSPPPTGPIRGVFLNTPNGPSSQNAGFTGYCWRYGTSVAMYILVDGANRTWYGFMGSNTSIVWDQSVGFKNIVGTVGQSGGLATGSIVERISNANGEGIRLADGTQICWGEATAYIEATAVVGNMAQSPGTTNFNFPVGFSGQPTVIPGAKTVSGFQRGWGVVNSQSAGAVQIVMYAPIVAARAILTYTAFGRWY